VCHHAHPKTDENRRQILCPMDYGRKFIAKERFKKLNIFLLPVVLYPFLIKLLESTIEVHDSGRIPY
jgi:hypothetical protein